MDSFFSQDNWAMGGVAGGIMIEDIPNVFQLPMSD
jgi:hypothetical protein